MQRGNAHCGLRRIAVLLALACLFSTAVSMAQKKPKKGQEQSRSVQGVVTAPDGAPVPGAVVQLKNTKTLQIRSFIAKENGTYSFHELSPDIDYELTATAGGASSGTRTLSSFDSRINANIDLKLNSKK